MSYQAARDSMDSGRKGQMASLLGEVGGSWFLDRWDSVASMLKSVSSESENAAVVAKYASASSAERAGCELRLDYVCALRRELRKQYVSEDSGVCTDVTPFRHGAVSSHGARVFDGLMDTVIRYAESVK